IVPGSGVLKDLTPPVALPVRDLATLMIVVSDNTAANLMIDLVGIDAINRSMRALGLTATVMEYKFFHAPPNSRGARSTPADLGEGRDCRYVIAMMSRDCKDRRFYVDNEAAVLLADVSALIYGYFGAGRGRG